MITFCVATFSESVIILTRYRTQSINKLPMGKVKIHFTGKEMDYVAKEENRMTEVAKRIEKLRALMAEQNIDAYVVPTADFHQSEYVGEHFKARKFITGFSGSYGTAVIAKDDAGLWTDGR